MGKLTNLKVKHYDICGGVKCSQRELTLERDYMVADIFAKIDLNELAKIEFKKIIEILRLLIDSKLIEQFLQVILIPDAGGLIPLEKLSKISNSELEEIFNDFFTLNPSAKKLWKTIGSGAVTQMMSTILSSLNSSAPNSTPVS